MIIDARRWCMEIPVSVILAALIIDKRRGSTSKKCRLGIGGVIANELEELLGWIEDIGNKYDQRKIIERTYVIDQWMKK